MSKDDRPMPATETAGDEFQHLDVAHVVVSLTNPRKNFNPARLQELTDSIKASGVHQPILVRPLPGYRVSDTTRAVTHEIVSGERRYRASLLADRATIPAMIRPLTDAQVLEIQIVENLQRDDLTELEEAEGYQALVDATGITKDDIGDKIGKSRSYVYGRLKLLDLSQECKQAMRAGQIDASRALLIARIPDQKLQIKTLKAFTDKDYNDEPKLSYRAAKLWVSQNVMLRLEHAVFKIADAKLCPDAGACGDCPKRTGANPDLFSDVDSPDVCTDPACFHAKEQAHHDKIVAEAQKKGMEVISGAEAEKLMPYRHAGIAGFDKTERHIHDPRTGGQTPLHMLLDEFIDKGELKAATKLFIDPYTHKPIKVVPDELVEQLEELLDQATAKNPKASKEDKARAKARLQEDEDRKRNDLTKKYEKAWRAKVLEALKPQLLAGAVSAFGPIVLRALLKSLAVDSYDFEEYAAQALDIDDSNGIDETDVERAVDATPDKQLGARICMLLAVRDADAREIWQSLGEDQGKQLIVAEASTLISLASSAGVDSQAIQTEVRHEMRAELAPQTASPDRPAARPAEKVGAKPSGKKPKLSAEEAKSGIAAAMQSEEQAASAKAVAPPAKPGVMVPVAAWPFPKTAAEKALELAAAKEAAEQAPADPLLAKAIEVITKTKKASVRLLKDELGIGTTKALELMASLEAAGKVSVAEERGARKVLVAA